MFAFVAKSSLNQNSFQTLKCFTYITYKTHCKCFMYMKDKHLKNSTSVFLEEAVLVKSFPLDKMRIRETANSVY